MWCALAAAGAAPLVALSFGTPVFTLPPLFGAAALVAIFLAALWVMIFPTQIVSVIAAFVYHHFTDRTRTGQTSGFNTAAQATGRALGTLASGVIYAALGADAAPPVGFGACVALTAATSVACAAVAATGFPGYGVGGVPCGPCVTCFRGGVDADAEAAA